MVEHCPVLSTLAMLRVTAVRSHALCAVLLAATVLGGVDAAKKSQKREKWVSVRAYSGSRPGDNKVEVREDAGKGERVLVCRPTSVGKRLAAPHWLQRGLYRAVGCLKRYR